MKTKRILFMAIACLMLVSVLAFAVSCGERSAEEQLWEGATYKKDTTLGEGAKTVYVDVIVYDNSVRITLKTDADNLGDALLETGLAEGDMGDFGLYMKKVNGISADYDTDGAYWSFCQGGEPLMYGVSYAEISGGEAYELVYAK